MKRILLASAVIGVLAGAAHAVLKAANRDRGQKPGAPRGEKKAVLVVSFGTSHLDSCEKTIGAIEREIAAAFPDREVRRAFTSGMILKKLKNRDGVEIDGVAEALGRLLDGGFTDVLVQPTHVMNGNEYEDMMREAAGFEGKFDQLRYGAPLLTSSEDYFQLIEAIREEVFPLLEDELLVYMGHGSDHEANAVYSALNFMLSQKGIHNVVVGTVEAYPDLPAVLAIAKQSGKKRIRLMPLMVVAGDHAKNDMAGGEEDSWDTAFRNAGFEVEAQLKGLGEYAAVRKLYVEHARAAAGE
ncbi:MAG TPA: sirohydrochlorin cobaltochelatase [Candidatus Fimivivens faecavium]|nr:sirohydrochlorin cobaltochelatase [Candidatus Fimivivens faecavium]